MKSILLPVHDDEGQTARVGAALAVARAVDGELNCLDVVALPRFGDYFSEASRMTLAGDEERRDADNRRRVLQRLQTEDIPYRWSEARGNFDTCVAAAADLADLIILTRDRFHRFGFDFHPIVLRAALKDKPVLSLPQDARHFRATGRALIGWDGSRGAIAMLRACVPLLQKASAVELLTVDYWGNAIPADEAAAYLSRHGVHSSICHQNPCGHRADEWLRVRCATWRADYCIMGAVGDSPLRHALFGSTTRRMLALADLPVILGG